MESRRRFLHPRDTRRRSDGDGVGDPLNGLRAKRSRRIPGKSGIGRQGVKGKRNRKRVAKRQGRLPRKASSKEVSSGPYQNRHRWAGRECQGERENCCQGTRQNGPVSSREGALSRESRSEKAQATV